MCIAFSEGTRLTFAVAVNINNKNLFELGLTIQANSARWGMLPREWWIFA
jgi:hypothetical protein